MAMAMPRRFRAAGMTHRVRVAAKTPAHWIGAQVGECDTRQNVVTIQGGLHPVLERQVLTHETLHAIITAAGMDYIFGEQGDELFVSTLAPHLLVFLRENPQVVAYLTDRSVA